MILNEASYYGPVRMMRPVWSFCRLHNFTQTVLRRTPLVHFDLIGEGAAWITVVSLKQTTRLHSLDRSWNNSIRDHAWPKKLCVTWPEKLGRLRVSKLGNHSILFPGRFALWSESSNRTLTNSHPGTFVPCDRFEALASTVLCALSFTVLVYCWWYVTSE